MIELRHVSKKYKEVTALDDFSFTFKSKAAYGILGINGAGKSTLIHCLTKNISFSGELDYHDLSRYDIGYVPQELAIYPELSVLENMLFFAAVNKISKKVAQNRSVELINTVGLQEKINTKASALSGGMKRKLNLITALVHNPSLLICDEICVGIDPVSRMEILEYLKKLKKDGLSIIYTSHYLEEVEFLCDQLVFLHQGSLVLQGSTNELIQELSLEEKKDSNLKDLFMKVLHGKE